ncbi:Uncharacterised protein [Mycobacteroides abscessus]|uniref:helix-turn-helix domain-containing protein n=1 Tax=Mycobacteroides abscessus TaxID=36809 RepID=UPI0005E54C4C|nr:helix-turn-helix domain-containing protein [Mycobacteroides abscessus]CPX20543.1 Uncharacterised protein [Mycobacteroides abscessus]CRG61208.1 Uncharacterised protein [Mycobacteroides abscessus]
MTDKNPDNQLDALRAHFENTPDALRAKLASALTAQQDTDDTVTAALRAVNDELGEVEDRLGTLRIQRAALIESARALGWSWKRIADVLGVARSTVPQYVKGTRGE